MQVIINNYPIDILTPHYRVYGEVRTIGDPTVYFNDQSICTVTVHDATLMPLREGMKLGAVSMDVLHVPKTEPQVLILGNFTPTIPPLPKKQRLVCFTDTYLLRGTFHMGQETAVEDVFYTTQKAFFYASNLDIYTLYPLAVDVATRADLGFINGSTIRAFYPATENGG